MSMAKLVSHDGYAETLAERFYKIDAGIERIFQMTADIYDFPEDFVALLEVNRETPARGFIPVWFGPCQRGEVQYPPVLIYSISPDEFKRVETGEMRLPKGIQFYRPLPLDEVKRPRMGLNREAYEKTHAIFEARWTQLTYVGLSKEEKGYLALWWMSGEVANGSYDQYFYNSSGDMVPEALSALYELGALRTVKILRDALAIFDSVGGYSTDRKVRQSRLAQLTKLERQRAFGAVSEALEANDEDYEWMASERLQRMYEKHDIDE